MSGRKDGGPAFPRGAFDSDRLIDEGADGMTLRQWYAGMVMAGFSANPERSAPFAQDAEDSFTQADAMLAYEQQENGDAA